MRVIDRRADPTAWARELGITREAVELYLACDVIDLHIDSFIWHRLIGYDLRRRHSPITRGVVLGQVDFPRIREAEISGATWVISTNPARDVRERGRLFERNLAELLDIFASVEDDFAIVRDHGEYQQARLAGKHAAFIGVQGGNAFDGDVEQLARLPKGVLLRVTVVHLSNSNFGSASAPLLGGNGGLTGLGVEFVRKLNEQRIFVDLAHASPRTFSEIVAVHDRSQPLLATHTGVSGVHRHWRNLDDEQIRAIAATGGTIGIIYHAPFLGDRLWAGRLESIVHHLEHVIAVAGDDHASLGSDWDGAIVLPRDMQSCLELPRLVDCMLRRGWQEERVRKVLGGNFLRTLRQLRG
ncbi:MAG TPA: membrane dipeptidase [Polyangiaceae bacterium]|nr:membrane dipeptidase [Polyangiaceae bacterium]